MIIAPSTSKAFVRHRGRPSSSGDSTPYSSSLFSAISKTTQHNDFLSLFNEAHQPRARTSHAAVISKPVAKNLLTQRTPLMTATANSWDGQHSACESSNRGNQSVDSMSSIGLPATEVANLEPSLPLTENAAIASLVSRMQNNVVIKDKAVQKSNAITVPRGHAVTYDLKPAEHYQNRREVKAHVKRKRDEGIFMKPLRGQAMNEVYGFRAQELNSAGAVSLQNCQPSDLTNKIHPLLVRARFDDTPDAIYDQLVPALRLASMFLTQPACMQFWVALALADRRDDPQMSLKYGRRCQRIDGHVELTDENIATVTKHLEDMGNANLVRFAFRHRSAMPTVDIWGCSAPIKDYRSGKAADLTTSLIMLHADYYIVAQKLSQLEYPEESQKLRFSFMFAVLVLHELAHSIEGAHIKMRHEQWIHMVHTKHYMEPFFMDWQRPPECGRTLEQTMFGGEIHPINKRVDGSHGVCTSDWPPHSSMADDARRLWFAVPTDYIQDLFQTEVWQQRGHLHDWTTFHIPRTGATSLYIFSFTTMPWSEELRVASEEAAELLTIARAQPATKKRKVASGEEDEPRCEEKAVIEAVIGENEAAELVAKHRTRRNSSCLASSYPGASRLSSRPHRSRSLGPIPTEPFRSLPTQEVIADELLRSFLHTYDSLPAHGTLLGRDKKPTSDLIKGIAKKRPLRPAGTHIAPRTG